MSILYLSVNVPTTQDEEIHSEGIGYATVDRVIASDTKGPNFESSPQQILLSIFRLTPNCT